MITSKPAGTKEPKAAIRELNHRRGDGIEVTLLWNAETDDVVVSVVERDGFTFQFQVPPAEAFDAFHHPYAYAAYHDWHEALAA